ncbi:MAG: anthranilate phosphoribosyltransferase [Chlamydiales bacterium]|jgi:anthranilate phosphoribosyltransferase
MLDKSIEKLIRRKTLSSLEASLSLEEILETADPVKAAAFLVLLRSKGEKACEVEGIVRTMQKHMLKITPKRDVLDIVGTGGDGASTVNISTGAAILGAACGVPIAKHGNRSVSSKCGSGDILESLGVEINMIPELIEKCIEEVGIAFLFAPNYHPAMKVVGPIRKSLGIRTVFNMLGPLLNPCQAPYLMIGVWDESLVSLLADVLSRLNVKRALVFHGCGLDELSPIGPASAILVEGESMQEMHIDPESLGVSPCTLEDLQGGDPSKNRSLLLSVFEGKRGAIADALILNAGVGLWVYGQAESIEAGLQLARQKLEDGTALGVLQKWVKFSQRGELCHVS